MWQNFPWNDFLKRGAWDNKPKKVQRECDEGKPADQMLLKSDVLYSCQPEPPLLFYCQIKHSVNAYWIVLPSGRAVGSLEPFSFVNGASVSDCWTLPNQHFYCFRHTSVSCLWSSNKYANIAGIKTFMSFTFQTLLSWLKFVVQYHSPPCWTGSTRVWFLLVSVMINYKQLISFPLRSPIPIFPVSSSQL